MTTAYPLEIKNNSFYSHVINRVHENNGNFNIIVDGLPRSGKSRACLKMAWDLDRSTTFQRRFDPENICFSFQDVLKRVNEIPESNVGRVVVWEEAGSYQGANSRSWQSDFNMEASKLFQTMGYRRLILIVNLPHYYMLDKQVRMLVHAKITMDKIDRRRGVSKGRLDLISPHRSEYDIFRSPGVSIDVKSNILHRMVYFSKPPLLVDKAYSEMEKGFKDKWIMESQQTLVDSKIEPVKKLPMFKQIVKIIEEYDMVNNSVNDILKIKEVQLISPSLDVVRSALRVVKARAVSFT